MKLNAYLAAAHVRRLAPVLRCSQDGTLDPAGSYWRYGPQVLDRVGLIRLAIRKGAKPEALAA